jgi:hypothetical protein
MVISKLHVVGKEDLHISHMEADGPHLYVCVRHSASHQERIDAHMLCAI